MTNLNLPNVTLLGIDCIDIARLQKAMDICQKHITFGQVKLLSSLDTDDLRLVKIKPINSIEEYSKFCIVDLHKYVDTTHVLMVQHDGFVLNPQSWTDEFLHYDYIGSPWYLKEEFWFERFSISRSLQGQHVVGNGGFCIRSKKFLQISATLAAQNKFTQYHPEDLVMCVHKRDLFEDLGIVFAPYKLAKRFSLEGSHETYSNQFGFHGHKWTDISKWIAKHPEYNITQQLRSWISADD